jgi:YD repeat-containing protein
MYGDTTRLYDRQFYATGFLVYDSLGRLVCDKTERWRTYRYQYDSSGILNHITFRDWDVTPKYRSTYTFYPDSLVLYQYWKDHEGPHHKSIFRFDDLGHLIREYNDDNRNTGGITRKTFRGFEWVNDTLKTIDEKTFVNDSLHYHCSTKLHYKKGKINSAIAEIDSKDNNSWRMTGKYKMITTYDTAGLRAQSVLADSIIIKYRHTKRR